MDKKDIKKVVLAYSGGLDTSIIIPWLKEVRAPSWTAWRKRRSRPAPPSCISRI